MTEATINTTPAPPTPDMWAIIEIWGHRRHSGFLSEVEMYGLRLVKVEVYGTGEKKPRETHIYNPTAIFGLTPESEKTCREFEDLPF